LASSFKDGLYERLFEALPHSQEEPLRTTRVPAHRVGVGDLAPDFALLSQSGQVVSLENLAAQSNVVLFFYPKDESVICTEEACAFRDSHKEFVARGAEVVGISSDSMRSHGRFVARHRLPFMLLSDLDGEVRRRYGVPDTLGPLPGRATYLVDRQRIVRHVYTSQFNAARHVEETLNALRKPSP
jgi:peroxiredoxin Q/BCP